MGLILDCIAFVEADSANRKALFAQYWKDRFPIVKWFPKYTRKKLVSDIIAGLTVGLMVVPQSLAYARIAGFNDLTYGLYASYIGCFVYAIFGTSKDITLGPTAIMSTIIVAARKKAVDSDDPNHNKYIFALTILCGFIQFAFGFLKLGMVVNLISLPVVSGFTSAAALVIATGQVQHLLGIRDLPTNVTISRNFLPCLIDTFKEIKHSHVWDIVMGFSCVALVVLLQYLKTHIQKWDDPDITPSQSQRVARKFLWAVSTARNAVVVLLAGLIAYAVCSMERNCWSKLKLVENISGGLPGAKVPDISDVEFSAAVIVIPLIGFLEAISIAQAFGRENGYRVDASQELIAIGISNILGSFFQSYPMTGSFSRTSVNAQSGVQTPLGGIFTGFVVLLALAFLTPLFRYIPNAALAAIIIAAVVHMINVKILKGIARMKPLELLPWAVSFFGTLFLGIQYGILIGAAIHLLFPLYRLMIPRHSCTYHGDVAVTKLTEGLFYAGVEELKTIIHDTLDKTAKRGMPLSVIVVDGSHMPSIDFTTIQGVQEIVTELDKKDVRLVFAALQDPVGASLRKADITGLIFMPSVQAALSEEERAFLSSTGIQKRGQIQ